MRGGPRAGHVLAESLGAGVERREASGPALPSDLRIEIAGIAARAERSRPVPAVLSPPHTPNDLTPGPSYLLELIAKLPEFRSAPPGFPRKEPSAARGLPPWSGRECATAPAGRRVSQDRATAGSSFRRKGACVLALAAARLVAAPGSDVCQPAAQHPRDDHPCVRPEFGFGPQGYPDTACVQAHSCDRCMHT
jgi:hypothetical protein